MRTQDAALSLRLLLGSRLRGFIILSTLLVVYANLRVAISTYIFEVSEAVLTLTSVIVAGLVLLWAVRVDKLSLESLGLTKKGALENGQIGLLFGAMLVIPALAFLAFPPSGVPVMSMGSVLSMNRVELLVQIFLRIPFGTVLIEEVAFRGALLASLKRLTSTQWAIIGSSLVFALWHIGVNFQIMESSLLSGAGDVMTLIIFASLYLGVFFAGCVWAALKELTGHLAAPMATHWIVYSSMVLVVFLNGGSIG